nr:integrase core domain-containing protein [Saccharothrix sp. NRRL B-16348]
MERWIRSCRRELLDRTVIQNRQHLLHALREYGKYYNTHRPHQGIANARPLRALPPAVTAQAALTRLDIRQRQPHCPLDGLANPAERWHRPGSPPHRPDLARVPHRPSPGRHRGSDLDDRASHITNRVPSSTAPRSEPTVAVTLCPFGRPANRASGPEARPPPS